MTADSAARMVAVLERLHGHWRRLELPIAEGLRPGLTDIEIDALSAPLGLTLPRELRTLYGWRDGADDTTKRGLYGPFYFRPLGDALRATRGGRVLATAIAQEHGGDAQRYWSDDWAQVFSTPSSRCIVVDCDPTGQQPARLAGIKAQDGNGERVADSITTILEWWADVYDQDGIAVEAGGRRLIRTLPDDWLPKAALASDVV